MASSHTTPRHQVVHVPSTQGSRSKFASKYKQAPKTQDSLTDMLVKDIIEVEEEMEKSWYDLLQSLRGTKLDSLILLIVTSAVIPIFKKLSTSPILGFLLTGTLLGPNGLSWVSDVHMMHVLGELGRLTFSHN